MHFYFNDLQEKQENQIVMQIEYFVMIFNKLREVLEGLCPKPLNSLTF